ncbi:MAG: arginase family protein [bacterium]
MPAATPPAPRGFFNLPISARPQAGHAALLAVPYMTATGDASALCAEAPEAMRRVSAEVKAGRWDIDLQRPLFAASPIDLGFFASSGDAATDRDQLTRRASEIIRADGRPLIVGGDDSVSIPPLQALRTLRGGAHLVQIDAHLDWKDHLRAERWGRSSVMRRASEMPWISAITQIGLRGVGTALGADAMAASEHGTLITARKMKSLRVDDMLRHIQDEHVYLTLDLDGINPAEMPAVPSPSPGGPGLDEIIEIILALAERHRLVGANLVECAPRRDVGGLGMRAAVRLLAVLADVLSVGRAAADA